MADYSKETNIEDYEMESIQESLDALKGAQSRFDTLKYLLSKKYRLGDKDQINILTGSITRFIPSDNLANENTNDGTANA
jgi:hypothetical protein